MQWRQVLDEHSWSADIGILRLRVQWHLVSDGLNYGAEVMNGAGFTLWMERGYPSVEAAKADAEQVARGILEEALRILSDD